MICDESKFWWFTFGLSITWCIQIRQYIDFNSHERKKKSVSSWWWVESGEQWRWLPSIGTYIHQTPNIKHQTVSFISFLVTNYSVSSLIHITFKLTFWQAMKINLQCVKSYTFYRFFHVYTLYTLHTETINHTSHTNSWY